MLDVGRVERLKGRALSEAERSIDVLGIDAKLKKEKDALVRAVHIEQRRVVRLIGRGRRRAKMQMTEAMRDPLRRLHAFGRREALAELRRLGYRGARAPGRKLESSRHDGDLRDVFDTLERELGALTVRVHRDAASADFGDLAGYEIARALLRIPGGRALAADVVSSAFTSGLAPVFEENENLIGGWEYTSVLDGGRCDPCRSKHGTTYASWADVQADLPGGGPNPECRGGGRCRCRAVPAPA